MFQQQEPQSLGPLSPGKMEPARVLEPPSPVVAKARPARGPGTPEPGTPRRAKASAPASARETASRLRPSPGSRRRRGGGLRPALCSVRLVEQNEGRCRAGRGDRRIRSRLVFAFDVEASDVDDARESADAIEEDGEIVVRAVELEGD